MSVKASKHFVFSYRLHFDYGFGHGREEQRKDPRSWEDKSFVWPSQRSRYSSCWLQALTKLLDRFTPYAEWPYFLVRLAREYLRWEFLLRKAFEVFVSNFKSPAKKAPWREMLSAGSSARLREIAMTLSSVIGDSIVSSYQQHVILETVVS